MNKTLKYVLIAVGIILFILLLVFSSNKPQYEEPTPEEMARIEVIRHQAYDYALKCGGKTTNGLSFEQITWIITPGSEIKYQTTDGVAHLKGYFSPRDSAIYIPYTEREKMWVAAHESLHALGWMGHPNKPFMYPCMLMAEQNP